MKNDSTLVPSPINGSKGRKISKILKTIILLVCFLLFSVNNYAFQQRQQLFTLSLKNASLKQVMEYVKEKSSYDFLYQDNDINNIRNVNVNVTNGSIREVLEQALAESPIDYSIWNNTITLFKKAVVRQEQDPPQGIKMFGKITDENGEPIPGASVIVKGSSTGVSSDIDGKYTINIEGDGKFLVVSFIGMQTQEVPVKQGEKNIILMEDQTVLEEVVITGYQKLGVNQAAGSFNTIKTTDFEKKIGPSIASMLEGLSPSLVVSAEPGGRKELSIRGVSTLQGSSSPLIIVDGFPYNEDLSTINPYEIESITLLKDAASASIYGAKSANGVIVISTKRGKKSDFEIRYSSTTQVGQKPDINYLMNRVSSSEMVDIETAYFKKRGEKMQSYRYLMEKGDQNANNHIAPKNKILQLLLAHKEKRITQKELDSQIALLREINNRDDLDRLLLQTPVFTEHSLSASYGGDQFGLRTSLNYYCDKSGFRGTKEQGVRYNLNSVFDISDRFRMDLLANLNIGNSASYRDEYSRFLGLSPYEKFYDNNGSPLPVTIPGAMRSSNNGGVSGGKDSYEIERLKKLGLLDETYYPATDYGLSHNVSENWGARFQTQMRLKIMEGLDGVLGFNINKRENTDRQIINKNSWEMRSFINNLTRKTDDGKKGEQIIPFGSRLMETRGGSTDYLFRGQLDFDKTFDKHQLIALIGSEFQANKITSTKVDRLGYDESSNLYREMDYYSLSKANLTNLFFPTGSIYGGIPFDNSFFETENRYVSFYANTNYSYDSKYVLSGSIRIDQSNLFGTDPRYRYRPFWSLGGKWRIAEEIFFNKNIFSQFDLQASYGINGNISNDYGPFDIAKYDYAPLSDMPSLYINSPAIPDLRWEQTGTFNIGLHTHAFNNKVSFSFDYYRKHSKDVLAYAETDPTLGYSSTVRNDATITNNGFEFALSTVNVETDNFTWNTFLNLNFNKSRVDKIYENDEEATYFLITKPLNRLGYEPRSLFVFEWAGVDKEGNGLVRKANGDLMAINYEGDFSPTGLTRADIKHAGTILPKTVIGLTNNLIYKNLSLSFMFVYQGGHITIRDGYNGEHFSSEPSSANIEAARAWMKPGDETTTIVPRLNSISYPSVSMFSTKNVIPADFIRLRDVVFSYTFPRKMLGTSGIKEFTINLTGKNLFLCTKNKHGIDPEAHDLGLRMFPVGKSITAGVNVTF